MLHGHVGSHPVVLQQVLESDMFIEDIAHQLRDQWPTRPMSEQGKAIGIIVFCQSGKHTVCGMGIPHPGFFAVHGLPCQGEPVCHEL